MFQYGRPENAILNLRGKLSENTTAFMFIAAATIPVFVFGAVSREYAATAYAVNCGLIAALAILIARRFFIRKALRKAERPRPMTSGVGEAHFAPVRGPLS